jgi:SAM-dependent methyltransferase
VKRPFSRLEAWVYERFIACGLLDVVLPAIEPHVHGRVLDVGCGGGELTRRLGAIGVDAALVQARRARGPCASALALPFADAAFDTVVSSCSIKHWPDPRAGMAECRRVLRLGGTIVVAEMDRDASRSDMLRWASRTRVPRAFHRLYAMFDERTILPDALSVAELGDLVGAPAHKLEGQPYLIAVSVMNDPQ